MNITPKTIAKSLHGIGELLDNANALAFPEKELNDMAKKSDEILDIIEARGILNSIDNAIKRLD